MATIITELKDLRHLKWTYIRHSSGSAGSFLKAYEIIDGVKTYYKLSNYNPIEGVWGHECVNEIIADRLLNLLEFPHLSYTLIHALVLIDGTEYETYVCKSDSFRTTFENKISLDTFYELKHIKGESPLEFCKRMGFYDRICQMLVLDYLILNRDRHGANLEVLMNRKTGEYRIAPIFDNGLALTFSCRNNDDLGKFDVTADLPVQSFVGSHSAYDNLQLIEEKQLKAIPSLDASIGSYLFEGLENIISAERIAKIQEMILKRIEIYEDFCNKR